MKPRVLHVLDDHSVGGIVTTTRHLSQSHLKDRFEFSLTTARDAISELRSRPTDIVIFRNPSAWHRSLDLVQLKQSAGALILHEHHYSAAFEQHKVFNQTRFRMMLRWCYHWVDRVVAISQGQERWMQQHRLVAPHKLVQINQCSKLDLLLTVSTKRIQRPLILAAYGRFEPQKGFDVLLKAMQLVQGLPIQLYLGGYGNDEAELKALACGLHTIKFWGTIQDVPAFLAAADVVVIPSRWEPWGNVCVEAKAAGKPVLVSDVDGLSEQAQNCGWRVAPNNPEILAKEIRSILDLDNSTLEELGCNARNSVTNAWDVYLEKWQTLLQSTLNSKCCEYESQREL